MADRGAEVDRADPRPALERRRDALRKELREVESAIAAEDTRAYAACAHHWVPDRSVCSHRTQYECSKCGRPR